jgi:mono/diheme cytochrome c family protein
MKHKTLLIASVCIGTLALATQGFAEPAELWKKHCQKCHAADGSGKTKMGEKLKLKDYTSAEVQAALKDEEMFKATKEGVKEGEKEVMPGYAAKLTDDEITSLVKYVRGLKK